MNKIGLKAIDKLLSGKKHHNCNCEFVFSNFFTIEESLFVDVEVTGPESYLGRKLHFDASEIINESWSMLGFESELILDKNLMYSDFTYNGNKIYRNDIETSYSLYEGVKIQLESRYGELSIKTPSGNELQISCEYEMVDTNMDGEGIYNDLYGSITNIWINGVEIFELPENITKSICYSLSYENDKMMEWLGDAFWGEYNTVFCLSDGDYYTGAIVEFNQIFDEFYEPSMSKYNSSWKKELDEFIERSRL